MSTQSTFADTDLASGSQPMYQVMVWNGDHTKRKLFKAYADKADAELTVAALRTHTLDAELVTVGAAGAASAG